MDKAFYTTFLRCNVLSATNLIQIGLIIVIVSAVSVGLGIFTHVSDARAQNMTTPSSNNIVETIQSAKGNVVGALSSLEGGIIRDAADQLHAADAQLERAITILTNTSQPSS